MKTIIILEWACLMIGITFLITQVAVPWVSGMPLLPLLRHQNRDVDRRLVDAAEGVERQKAEAQIRALKRRKVV